jgi:hypothetical protein
VAGRAGATAHWLRQIRGHDTDYLIKGRLCKGTRFRSSGLNFTLYYGYKYGDIVAWDHRQGRKMTHAVAVLQGDTSFDLIEGNGIADGVCAAAALCHEPL